jgi:replicative DNA helicase
MSQNTDINSQYSSEEKLTKYGQEFQCKAIAGILTDLNFLERIYDMLDIRYWEISSHQWLIDEIKKYYIQYKNIPSLTVFKVLIDSIESDLLKKSVIEQLRLIYQKTTETDIKFVKEQFLEFCKNQKLKNAIISSVDFLKEGRYDAIKHIIDEALKAGMERNLGHDYVADFEKRMESIARDCVKTHWPQIDALLDGGLGKGELGILIGSSGSGKSWLLSKIGLEALKQGKNVMHFTLELNEHYIGRRYDACLTGIDFQSIPDNKEKILPRITDLPGKLKIKYFPLKTVSANSLKLHIDRLQMLEHKTDLIIVDYADILKSMMSDKSVNSYTDAGNIYEELRSVAGQLGIPCWSASQCNRSSNDTDIVDAHHVADSYRKIMTSDFVMSVSRKMADAANNTARFYIVKNRFGGDRILMPAIFNTNNGDIKIYDLNSSEGMDIQSKMDAANIDDDDDNEELLKKIIKNKWTSLES